VRVRQRQQRRTQAGFTLVELLVASAILVVLGVAGYVGLDVVLGTAERTTQESQRLHRLQRCFTQLAMDLEQALGRPIRDDLGDEQAALSYQSGLASLEFTRGGLPNPAGWPRSSMQRVAYSLEEDKLARVYWRELDRLQGSEPVRRVLLDRVTSLEFRFLDAQSEWHDQWPPLSGGSLQVSTIPAAVELKLELEDWGELRRVYALPG
jgi:general secretion pathway protein J